MGSLDEYGVYIYDETDQVSPIHTYSNLGQASVSAALEYLHEHSLIMPVANAAERDAYAADMAASGRPASLARPLWVERADTGAVERNRGAGWHTMIDNSLDKHAITDGGSLWEPNNLLTKKNGWVMLRIRQKRTGPALSTGSRDIIAPGQFPSRFRPSDTIYSPAIVYLRNSYTRSVFLSVTPGGTVRVYNFAMATNNWLNADVTWPTDD